jgi:polysaccharide pyruvyl transferase WcaK-like protein
LSRDQKIGVLGHVGNENLGDEAIVAAVIKTLNSDIRVLRFMALLSIQRIPENGIELWLSQ